MYFDYTPELWLTPPFVDIVMDLQRSRSTVKTLKPTALIGVSTIPQSFTKEVMSIILMLFVYDDRVVSVSLSCLNWTKCVVTNNNFYCIVKYFCNIRHIASVVQPIP